MLKKLYTSVSTTWCRILVRIKDARHICMMSFLKKIFLLLNKLLFIPKIWHIIQHTFLTLHFLLQYFYQRSFFIGKLSVFLVTPYIYLVCIMYNISIFNEILFKNLVVYSVNIQIMYIVMLSQYLIKKKTSFDLINFIYFI